MYISDLHDYSDEPSKVAEEFLKSDRSKPIKEAIEQIVDTEFERLVDYASDHISQVAADRAEGFLKRVLGGDADAAMALLGDYASERYRTYGDGKPWAHLIHGDLFLTDGMKLRQQIVEAHPELLRNARIKDLESIVDGLTQQVLKLEAEIERITGRYS